MPGSGSCYEVFTQMVLNFACNAGDLGSVPGLGRFPGEGKGHPLQHSSLESSIDYMVHRVAESGTPLSDFHFTSFHLSWHRKSNTLSQFKKKKPKLTKLGMEGNFFNLIKATNGNLRVNVILSCKSLRTFLLRPRARQGCSVSQGDWGWGCGGRKKKLKDKHYAYWRKKQNYLCVWIYMGMGWVQAQKEKDWLWVDSYWNRRIDTFSSNFMYITKFCIMKIFKNINCNIGRVFFFKQW